MRATPLLSLPLILLFLSTADASGACEPAEAGCNFHIRIASAKYGAEDHWCSGLNWVARGCNGRWICPISLPEIDDGPGERSEMRRKTICGPLSAARKSLSIGWYCSDGVTFIGQPTVALQDGEQALLSCSRP